MELLEFYKYATSSIFNFCDVCNTQPTHQQEQLYAAVQLRRRRIAVKSGQGPGKTFGSVLSMLYRMLSSCDLNKDIYHRGIVTAPSMKQAKDVWLGTVNDVLKQSDQLLSKFFTLTKTRFYCMGKEDWCCNLVTATKDTNIQGYHRPFMTIVVEEASGVSEQAFIPLKGTATNKDCVFLAIGNPNTRNCEFFKCFTVNRHLWTTITWDAEETPNSSWFSDDRNKELADEYGVDSDIYRIRVKGQFPKSDPASLFNIEDLEYCSTEHLRNRFIRIGNKKHVKQIGIDLSRFGGDEATVYVRSGNSIVDKYICARKEPAHVIQTAFKMQKDRNWRDRDCTYVFDGTSMGQGCVYLFSSARKKFFPLVYNTKPFNRKLYANRITEAYFEFAKLVKSRSAYIPKDNIMFQQLSLREYDYDKHGRFVLLTKEDHKKWDRADGVVMAYYDVQRETTTQTIRKNRIKPIMSDVVRDIS